MEVLCRQWVRIVSTVSLICFCLQTEFPQDLKVSYQLFFYIPLTNQMIFFFCFFAIFPLSLSWFFCLGSFIFVFYFFFFFFFNRKCSSITLLNRFFWSWHVHLISQYQLLRELWTYVWIQGTWGWWIVRNFDKSLISTNRWRYMQKNVLSFKKCQKLIF